MSCFEHDDKGAGQLLDEAIQLIEDFRLQEAQKILEHLLKHHTDSLPEWNIREYLGESLYYANDYLSAVFHLERARLSVERIEENGLNIMHILDVLAEAHRMLEDYKQSMVYFDEAESYLRYYAGKDWRVARYLYHLGKGRCHLYLVQRQEALREFGLSAQELDRASTDPEELVRQNLLDYEIGRVYVLEQDVDKALEHLNRVDPDKLDRTHLPHYHYTLMRLAILREDFSLAVEEYGKCFDDGVADADDPLPRFWLAIALRGQGLHAEAIQCLREVLAHRDSDDYLREQASGVLKELGAIA